MRACPACSREIQGGAPFCPHCGAVAAAPEVAQLAARWSGLSEPERRDAWLRLTRTEQAQVTALLQRPSPSAPATSKLGDHAGMRLLLPVGRSAWAIAAGYLGLFSFLVLPAPLALIAGGIAIWDIKTHPDRHGLGRAIFGLIMGLLGTALLVAILVVAARA